MVEEIKIMNFIFKMARLSKRNKKRLFSESEKKSNKNNLFAEHRNLEKEIKN
jgi:hypothetical protein